MSTNISEEITNIVDALTLSKNLLEKALHKIEILSNDTLARFKVELSVKSYKP